MRRLVRDPWFENKAVGWGLAPARWQGWLATVSFAVVLAASLSAIARLGHGHGAGMYAALVAAGAVEVLAFMALAVLTSVWLEAR